MKGEFGVIAPGVAPAAAATEMLVNFTNKVLPLFPVNPAILMFVFGRDDCTTISSPTANPAVLPVTVKVTNWFIVE